MHVETFVRHSDAVTCNVCAAAAAGHNGLLDPVEPGLACGSDTAHLSLLGYDPRKCGCDCVLQLLGTTSSNRH